ncbi:MAG: hypothetical protein U0269_13405 [Polyangiales bacterium]
MTRTTAAALGSIASLALIGCTRPTESAPVAEPARIVATTDAARALTDSAVARAPARRSIAPVALALSAERSLLVIVKEQTDEPDAEITPTLAGLGALSASAATANRPADREVSLTPEHRVLSFDGTSLATIALPAATASLLVLDTHALLALPSDESAPVRRLARSSQWSEVEPPLQQLLRRRVGAGELATPVGSRWITTTGPEPLAVFAACDESQHEWGGAPCAIHSADASAPVAFVGEPRALTAARAANGVVALLRAHCPAATEVLRCPLEGVTLNAGTPSIARLGWQSMQSQEGNSSGGWRMVAPWQDTVVVAWTSRDREQDARWSLRLARLDPRARRFAALPPIPCEGSCRALAFGGSPLTVVWSDEETPNALTVSTLAANNRWSASSVAPFEGRAVDALVQQEGTATTITVLVATRPNGASLVRRAGSGEWQTIAIPSA